MKKYLIIFVIMMVWIMSYCGEEKSPPAQKQKVPSSANQTSPKQKQSEPVQKQMNGTWPFIKDDEQAVELAENLTAKNYVLVFDGSGSMKEVDCSGGRPKIDVAREAVAEWSRTMDKDANLGLVAFNWKGWYIEPLTAGQRQSFIDRVTGVEAGGKTPLTKAVWQAYNSLTKQGRRQLGYGEYTVVVVTDGIANNQSLLATQVKSILAKSPVDIYTIGFCIGENHSLNQPGYTIYKAADNPAELKEKLKEVLAESDTFDDVSFDD